MLPLIGTSRPHVMPPPSICLVAPICAAAARLTTLVCLWSCLCNSTCTAPLNHPPFPCCARGSALAWGSVSCCLGVSQSASMTTSRHYLCFVSGSLTKLTVLDEQVVLNIDTVLPIIDLIYTLLLTWVLKSLKHPVQSPGGTPLLFARLYESSNALKEDQTY